MDFTEMIQKERNRITTELEKLTQQRSTLDEQEDSLKRELKAIDAYEQAKTGRKQTRGKRATGISDKILDQLKNKPMSRAQIIEALGGKGNKRMEGSISNALTNLKKAKKIDAKDGAYATIS
jgi:hypothetical protein